MIKIIAGAKGAGKTKKLIDAANKDVASAKGVLAFITDTKRYMYDLNRAVSFIDVTDYKIAGEDALCGFVKGVAADNHDYEYIYIDGIARIAGKELSEMAGIFYMLEKLAAENNIVITITCSCPAEELPDFIAKYA